MATRKVRYKPHHLMLLEEEARRQRQIVRNQATIALIEARIAEDAAGDPVVQKRSGKISRRH